MVRPKDEYFMLELYLKPAPRETPAAEQAPVALSHPLDDGAGHQ